MMLVNRTATTKHISTLRVLEHLCFLSTVGLPPSFPLMRGVPRIDTCMWRRVGDDWITICSKENTY